MRNKILKISSITRGALYVGVALLLLSSVGVITPTPAQASLGACTKDPNYGEYYNGESFAVSTASPADYGYGISWSPSVISIPAAIPRTQIPPFFNFPIVADGRDRGSFSKTVQVSYFDRDGNRQTESCDLTYSVKICQSWYVEYGYQDTPCSRQGGPGGDGGGGDGFAISCSPTTRSIDPGGATTYTVTVTPSGTFNEAVIITAATPRNVRSETRQVVRSGTVTMPIFSDTTAPPGDYTITFNAYSTDSGLSSEAYCALHINSPIAYPTPTTYPTPTPTYPTPTSADFGLRCDPPTRTITQGGGTTYTVYVDSIGGFNSPVNLSIGVSPAALQPPTVGLATTSLIPPGSTQAWVTTNSATTIGQYTVTVTGTVGNVQHRCTAALEITAIITACAPTCPNPYSTPGGGPTPYPSPTYPTPSYPTPSSNLSTSDKDIVELNGVPNPNASPANSISDFPSKVFFRAGDTVRYRISIRNSGSVTFSNVGIVDTFIHARLASQPKIKFQGCSGQLTSPTTGDTITFKLATKIEPDSICSILFNAVIVAPAGVTDGIYRFKNTGKISGDGISKTVETPALPFVVSRAPQKEEVAP